MKPLKESLLNGRDLGAVGAAAGMLRDQFPVKGVILYGSQARGDAGEDSDLELHGKRHPYQYPDRHGR